MTDVTAGRPMKFTPERIQQIRNLLERGMGREEIAETIGVTLGSLQVTCSRLGISLRRPVYNNGVGVLPKKAPPPVVRTPSPPIAASGDNGGAYVGGTRMLITLNIEMTSKGRQRTVKIPLTQELIGQLKFEAEFRGMSLGDLISEVLKQTLEKDLFGTVLGPPDA